MPSAITKNLIKGNADKIGEEQNQIRDNIGKDDPTMIDFLCKSHR
jgi:hypothetical protein